MLLSVLNKGVRFTVNKQKGQLAWRGRVTNVKESKGFTNVCTGWSCWESLLLGGHPGKLAGGDGVSTAAYLKNRYQRLSKKSAQYQIMHPPPPLWDVVVNEKIGNMFLGSQWEPQDWWINSTLDHDLRICLVVSPLPIPISVPLFIYSTPISTPIAPDLPPRFDSPTLCALPPVIHWIFKNGV